MASLAWMLVRNVTSPVALTTLALAGLASGFAAWGTHHAVKARGKTRTDSQRANELHCRYMVASWFTNPEDPVWVLFNTRDDIRGKTTH